MRLRSVTVIAAIFLVASAAAAQGVFGPPAEQAGGPPSVAAIPHDTAEPFASLVIDETIVCFARHR
jgi:hypothetical protein